SSRPSHLFVFAPPLRHTLLCSVTLFFFNDPATTELSPLSLHDALPIYRLPALEHLWRVRPGLSDLAASGAEVSDEAVAERTRTAKATDTATLVYTSGTTGRPKGCQLSHENLLSDVRNAFMGPLATITGTPGVRTL